MPFVDLLCPSVSVYLSLQALAKREFVFSGFWLLFICGFSNGIDLVLLVVRSYHSFIHGWSCLVLQLLISA